MPGKITLAFSDNTQHPASDGLLANCSPIRPSSCSSLIDQHCKCKRTRATPAHQAPTKLGLIFPPGRAIFLPGSCRIRRMTPFGRSPCSLLVLSPEQVCLGQFCAHKSHKTGWEPKIWNSMSRPPLSWTTVEVCLAQVARNALKGTRMAQPGSMSIFRWATMATGSPTCFNQTKMPSRHVRKKHNKNGHQLGRKGPEPWPRCTDPSVQNGTYVHQPLDNETSRINIHQRGLKQNLSHTQMLAW